MCKNFLIPTGIPLKIFLSFLALELLYQGITIYLIKSIINFIAFLVFEFNINLLNKSIFFDIKQILYIFPIIFKQLAKTFLLLENTDCKTIS